MPKPVLEITNIVNELNAWRDELRDQYLELEEKEENQKSDADEEQMMDLDSKCDEIESVIDQLEDL